MKADHLHPPVMVVDDDDNDVVLLSRLLKSAGIRNPLIHFRNGGDAFMFLKQFCGPDRTRVQKPVVVFLDVNMQGLSGFDVLAWARQQTELAGMKIFMLSGAREEWDAQISAKLGADEYLEKFPDTETITDLLAEVCTIPSR